MKPKLFLALLMMIYANVSFAQCTEAKDPEMAKYMHLTKTRDPQGCSECGMLALYFCSARHTTTDADKAKVSQLIDACKSNIRQMGEPYCCPDYLNKQPEWGVSAGKSAPGATTSSSGNAPAAENQASPKSTADVLLELNQAGLASQKAASAMHQSTMISDGAKTPEQIEKEYAEKAKTINQSADQLKKGEDAKLQSYFNTGMSGIADANLQNSLASAGSYIHALEAEAERKKALDMLNFQKTVALQKLENEKKHQQTDNRLRESNTTANEASMAAIRSFKASGHEIGMTLDAAKKQYRDFFKKALKPTNTPRGSKIKSKLKKHLPGEPEAFYVKNDMVVGHEIIVAMFPFDPGFNSGFDATNAKLTELEQLFGVAPIVTEGTGDRQTGTTKWYTWKSGNRSVILEFTRIDLGMFQGSEVLIVVLDE